MKPFLFPPAATELSSLERAVISLSHNDPVSSLRPKSRNGSWFLGRRFEAQALANPALESLRRYAILRKGNRSALEVNAERKRLSELGYGRKKIAAVDRLVTPNRSEPPPLNRASKVPRGGTAPQPSGHGRSANFLSEAIGVCMQYRAPWFAPLVGAALILPLCAGVAHAQTEPPIEAPVEVPKEEGPPGGPDGPAGPGDENHFAIGIGAAYMPAYHGSDKYRFQVLPAINIKYDRFFLNFEDGLGANLIDTQHITVGAGVVMADNYRAKDVPDGIGKLPFGVGARGFVKGRLAGFEATLGGTQIFAGSTKGFVADASISRPIMISQKLFLNPSVGTSWGNEKHLNRYFGVNAQQSLASGLPQYRLKSGIVDIKVELGAQYRLTDNIGIGLAGGVTKLMGDAKDSPIVKKETRPYGIVFVSYGF